MMAASSAPIGSRRGVSSGTPSCCPARRNQRVALRRSSLPSSLQSRRDDLSRQPSATTPHPVDLPHRISVWTRRLIHQSPHHARLSVRVKRVGNRYDQPIHIS
jgi:hypothetical protein